MLNVQPLEEVELEVDYMHRGQMAHELLAVFHRHVNEARRAAVAGRAGTEPIIERLLAEAIAETLAAAGPRQPGRCLARDRSPHPAPVA